jgi:hypothetical protein
VLRPAIRFLTVPADDDEPCTTRGTVPHGVFVPRHLTTIPKDFAISGGRGDGPDGVAPGRTAIEVSAAIEDLLRTPGVEPSARW